MSTPGSLRFICILLVMFTCKIQAIFSNNVNERTYNITISGERITCLKCSSGLHWVSNCTQNNTTGVCQQCADGTFMTNYNIAIRCEYCQECNAQRMRLATNCTLEHNAVCECVHGYYEKAKGACIKWSASCPLGKRQKFSGNAHNDTICEQCPDGTFSHTQGLPCGNCTSCPVGEIEQEECTHTADRKCSPAPKLKGRPASSISPGIIAVIVIVIVIVVILFVGAIVCRKRKTIKKRWSVYCKRKGGDYKQTNSDDPQNGGLANGHGSELGGMASNGGSPAKPVRLSGHGSELGGMASNGGSPVKPVRLSDQLLNDLSGDLNSNIWKSVMIGLFPKDAEAMQYIDEAVSNNHGNLRDQISAVFQKWRQKYPKEATLEKIIDTLREKGRNDLADKYETLRGDGNV